MTTEAYSQGAIKAALLAGQIDASEAVRRLLRSWFGGGAYSARDIQDATNVINSWGAAGTTTGSQGDVMARPSVVGGMSAQALGEAEPFAAYLSRYNLPTYGQSAAQRWTERQYAPISAGWQAASALSPAGTTPTDWATYLGGVPAGSIASRQEAGTQFRQALGKGPEEQRQFAEQLGATEASPTGGAFGAFLSNLLAGRYAAPVASRMAGWLPGMAEQFMAESQGSPEASFLTYLKNRLRL